MTDPIHIDGSQGEGGGQIVRSSLALSMVTGRSLVVENVRAGRKKPGLLRQHLTALNAAARVANAEVSGAELGSCSFTFSPQMVTPGEFHFSVGTAGSATLVLQTVLPALICADGPSRLTLEGGTHNQWAPPFEFLAKAFLPQVNRMGPQVSVDLKRHGFFPAGGGRFTVSIEPSPTLHGFDLLERGELQKRSITALVSNLPAHIGRREVETIARRMSWDSRCGHVEEVTAHGPGNVVMASLEYEHVSEIFTGFGRIGAPAEHVAREVVRDVRKYLSAEVPVGEYLADQLLLPLGISAWQVDAARRGGSFRTVPLSRHSTTHIELLREILGVEIQVDSDEEGRPVTVSVRPPTGMSA